MKVSLNTIKSLINFDLPPIGELVERINAQLGGVEKVIDLGTKYKDALIVKVVECENHPNADRLKVCKIDVGKKELVQVVCGAPNVKNDMLTVWLPPESIVPSTFDDKEPFKLDVRELRGVMSRGMLASAKELALDDDHDGILEIEPKAISKKDGFIVPGDNFAATFGLDDTIIDIENKMFTHRPDCFGQYGVAREIAGIFGQPFESPKGYIPKPTFLEGEGLDLKIFNDIPFAVPRFMAVALDNIIVGKSPLWLQCELICLGSKPINNIVDATNYVMLMSGQPTHAYDYDKLRGATIGARMAQKGEKLELLNGKTYEFTEDDIVITDGKGPIGLAGIMGGNNSEVSADTQRVVLECANFNMYAVRRSSMRHGLFTDAVTRFNKGPSPEQCDQALNYLINGIDAVMKNNAIQSTTIFDLPKIIPKSQPINVSSQFVNDRLGTHLSIVEQKRLLENVEMTVEQKGEELIVTLPFWRTDIALPEDIVEEVGRLYGFDKLTRELPERKTIPTPKNSSRKVKQTIRENLSRAGANEVLTYSFVHENILRKAEQDVDQAFRVGNALSPDLQYYRLSVLPSLLDKVHMNIKAGHDEFVLFEIGKGHNKKYHAADDDGLPKELEFVDAVYASKNKKEGAAYYHVRRLVMQLCRDLGFRLVFKPIEKPLDYPVTAPFDQTRSALVETRDGIFIGMIGELTSSVVKNFKLPHYIAAMTLDIQGLKKAYEIKQQTYAPLGKYPSISHDISIKTLLAVKYVDVFATVHTALDDLLSPKLELLSIYQAKNDNKNKTITFRVTLTSYDKTLTNDEASAQMQNIADALKQKLGAIIE